MIIRYRTQALADIDEIFQYLHARSPSGALNVLRAIYAGDIRVKVVRRYRYKIFYSVSGDSIEIVHIRHTARRPWP